MTALPGDIVKGKTAYTQGSDDPTTGTLQLTGNAQASHVLAGETFYTTDCKTKLTGTMTVNSLLAFSVAAYSGRRVLAKWQNPNQAAGKPFSGVIIRYSTSGCPGTTGGTQIYKGAGNNTAAGAWSQAYLDMPALNTTYYFSCYPYATHNTGTITGAVRNITCKTSAVINKTFTASSQYTVPIGYTKMDLFAVGGGGKGDAGIGNRDDQFGGGGGGSGYAKTITGIAVSGGQSINVVVGAGSSKYGTNGGTSSVTRNGSSILSAVGGTSPEYLFAYSSGSGGSGGGSGGRDSGTKENRAGGSGGSNGGSGGAAAGGGSTGQGTTTRAWGLSNGTLYAGGGGGGGGGSTSKDYDAPYGGGGSGGAGGGGAGGGGAINAIAGRSGSANTGGGGGGSGGHHSDGNSAASGNGGSGIVLMKLY